MKVLVLGGTQFIGRTITDALLHAGHDVSVLNRGTRPLWDPRLAQLTADRTDPAQVAAALGGAGRHDALVDVSGTEPLHLEGVLKALPDLGAMRYVFISSSAVYTRDAATPPFRETDPATGDPIWGDYGVDKVRCETLLRNAVGEDALTVLRPPYVYGPHNNEQRERSLWGRMLAGQPIFVPGSGDTRIQFCHAGALAKTVTAAVEGRLAAGTYNVGEPRTYSFSEYLRILADVAGAAPRLLNVIDQSVPARSYFPFRAVEINLSVEKLAATGFGDEPALADGLAETFAWFQQEGGIVDDPSPLEAAWRKAL